MKGKKKICCHFQMEMKFWTKCYNLCTLCTLRSNLVTVVHMPRKHREDSHCLKREKNVRKRSPLLLTRLV